MKTIAVFCGATVACNKQRKYYSLAYKTGKLLAEENFKVICGGGTGLMDELCRGVIVNGGYTVGICLDKPKLLCSKYLSDKLLFPDLYTRQQKILEAGDVYLALPGGVGTFFEILEIIERKKIGEISLEKPLVVVDNYFHYLRKLLEKSHEEGYTLEDLDMFVQFVSDIEQGINLIK